MNELGDMYYSGSQYYGRGVAKDYAQARQWYEKAADKGNVVAMNNLDVLYQNGWTTRRLASGSKRPPTLATRMLSRRSHTCRPKYTHQGGLLSRPHGL
jgi:TPR repeat protein